MKLADASSSSSSSSSSSLTALATLEQATNPLFLLLLFLFFLHFFFCFSFYVTCPPLQLVSISKVKQLLNFAVGFALPANKLLQVVVVFVVVAVVAVVIHLKSLPVCIRIGIPAAFVYSQQPQLPSDLHNVILKVESKERERERGREIEGVRERVTELKRGADCDIAQLATLSTSVASISRTNIAINS